MSDPGSLRGTLQQVRDNAELVLKKQPGAERQVLAEIIAFADAALHARPIRQAALTVFNPQGKEYLVFVGDQYYPGGGWADYLSEHEGLDVARAAMTQAMEEGSRVTFQWGHIVDAETREIVDEVN